MPLAYPRGRPRHAPPKGPDCFALTYMYNFFETQAGREFAYPLRGGAPPYGKCWIRHSMPPAIFVQENSDQSTLTPENFLT